MLREQVVCLANHKTSGEVSENSSTESSERLEHIYKLYKAKHGESGSVAGHMLLFVCLLLLFLAEIGIFFTWS